MIGWEFFKHSRNSVGIIWIFNIFSRTIARNFFFTDVFNGNNRGWVIFIESSNHFGKELTSNGFYSQIIAKHVDKIVIADKFFGSKLFSDEVYEKELKYYVKKTNEYGTPLDSRKDYTKSDWILWCASMAKTDEEAQALIAPVEHYLETTATRVPFSDWYETVTGEYCHFMGRSVQGGIFMPVLMKKFGQ